MPYAISVAPNPGFDGLSCCLAWTVCLCCVTHLPLPLVLLPAMWPHQGLLVSSMSRNELAAVYQNEQQMIGDRLQMQQYGMGHKLWSEIKRLSAV